MKPLPRREINLSLTARLLEAFRTDLERAFYPGLPPELCRVRDEAASQLIRHAERRVRRSIDR